MGEDASDAKPPVIDVGSPFAVGGGRMGDQKPLWRRSRRQLRCRFARVVLATTVQVQDCFALLAEFIQQVTAALGGGLRLSFCRKRFAVAEYS